MHRHEKREFVLARHDGSSMVNAMEQQHLEPVVMSELDEHKNSSKDN